MSSMTRWSASRCSIVRATCHSVRWILFTNKSCLDREQFSCESIDRQLIDRELFYTVDLIGINQNGLLPLLLESSIASSCMDIYGHIRTSMLDLGVGGDRTHAAAWFGLLAQPLPHLREGDLALLATLPRGRDAARR